MASRVVVLVSIVATVTVGRSVAADMKLDDGFVGDTPVIQGRCPPLGFSEYTVTLNGSDVPMVDGCAFLDFKSHDFLMVKSFSLWLGRLNIDGPRCIDQGLEHIRFSCLTLTTPLVDSVKRSLYVRLFGRVVNPPLGADPPGVRCALYKMVDENAFLMAISKDDSCNGLPNVLSESNPEPMSADGFTLLRMDKPILSA